MVESFKAIFSLKNLRRAPGDAGSLKRFTEIVHETETDVFVQRNGTISDWPGSMNLVVRVCATHLKTIPDIYFFHSSILDFHILDVLIYIVIYFLCKANA